MRGTILLTLVLALGCGARTDLEHAQRERRDAGFFQTFPCRWSLGERLELARGESFTQLTGAMHPRSSRAALLAMSGGAAVGGRVSVQATPELLAPLEEHRGRLFTGSDGWLGQVGDGCGLFAYDDALVETGRAGWGAARCELTQSVVGRVESLSLAESALATITFPNVAPIGERAPGAISGGAIAYDPDRGALSAAESSGGITITRPPERLFVEGADTVSVAPDRLRGGTLVLYRRADRRFELAHLGWEGALELVPLADLGRLEPVGPLVSNETEALVPLRDGSMLFVPLSHFEPRFTEPVEPGGVHAMEIVLRPGESTGGLLYSHSLASGESALVFRSLVCNR